jgi:chemotaxis protein methyltransferase CheR
MITIKNDEFVKLSDYIKTNYGINLTQKRDLLVNRLQQILEQKNFDSFTDYYQYVINDTSGEAVVELLNKVTTNHTFFLREIAHFNFLKDRILPELCQTVKDRDIRIWSAGCSSGEEPYSIAMTVSDFFGFNKNNWDTRILATDISQRALEVAGQGVYTGEQLAGVPPEWLRSYFKKIGPGHFTVTEKLKNEVIFRIFNLNGETFPFRKKFHLIFCRNVMIYFDAPTKQNLVERFYEQTEPGGYLFIGHAETVNRMESKYQYIQPAIYRKV